MLIIVNCNLKKIRILLKVDDCSLVEVDLNVE